MMKQQVIDIVQVGMGPLGVALAKHIESRSRFRTVGAIDISEDLVGKSLSELDPELIGDLKIVSQVKELSSGHGAQVIALTTVSKFEQIYKQIESLAFMGLPIVTSCEELSYPWKTQPELSTALDGLAKKSGIAILATGINPGFLMDTLPLTLSSVCQSVESIKIERVQDASKRRVPFQKKIGAGLSPNQFQKQVQEKNIRHVGLSESIWMLGDRMGWDFEEVSDDIEALVASQDCGSADVSVPAGYVHGVKQIGRGIYRGQEKVRMEFIAGLDIKTGSFDRVSIEGNPSLVSTIEGGVHGDVGTCSVLVNAIPSLLKAEPGLHSMADIALCSFQG
ncbi:MAG: hypothetical protein KDD52_07240 [Bdellovibrionales bacterium]|nr:hypothetical protein [Bdellovibrionales bacterium]